MKKLLGIVNNNIDKVSTSLERMKSCWPVKVLGFGERLDKPTKTQQILLVPTVGVLRSNAQVLNQCPNTIVFVFDAPVLVSELRPIEILDLEKRTLDYLFRFRSLEARDVQYAVRKAMSSGENEEITRKTIDLGSKLLGRTYGSVIAKYLTFSYRISDSSLRPKLLADFVSHVWDDKAEVYGELICKSHSRSTAAKEFAKQLGTEETKNFVAAVQKIRLLKDKAKGKDKAITAIPYDKLAKDHKISPFDLRYLMKVKQQVDANSVKAKS